jgi:hypothetical protein
MYLGEIHNIDGKLMVHLPSVPTTQKWYPLSEFNNIQIPDKFDSRIVEVKLIPNHGDLDEQPEYTARIVSPIFNLN